MSLPRALGERGDGAGGEAAFGGAAAVENVPGFGEFLKALIPTNPMAFSLAAT